MKYELTVPILKGEGWYGTDVTKGTKMPIMRRSKFRNDNRVVSNFNQSTPLMLSSLGRFVWSEDGYVVRTKGGKLCFSSDTAEIKLYDGYETLRGAYHAASAKFFPPQNRMPNELMFRNPQYCTWIELMTNQRQTAILDYAQSILDCGMPAGELIIDDGWQQDFGEWLFHKEKFEDAKSMIDQLHTMGFKVILWICPFISPKCSDYAYLAANNCLVREADGSIAERTWWNGTHPVLDLSNPKATEWFFKTADYLMRECGADGFKQDAGDGYYYKDSDMTYGNVKANEQTVKWHDTALAYDFNELRACWKCGCSGVAQRLCDKYHNWSAVRRLIPDALLQGVSGYAFTCPDMIGGGINSDFLPGKKIDDELLVRSAQCSALMPMMQYSLSVWRRGNPDTVRLTIEACKTHLDYSDYILELARESMRTGEPIIRYCEYVFPRQGLLNAKFQFMLGERYLVAPMLWKGKKSRKVMLPKGKWRYRGEEIEGGRTLRITANIEELPVFERI